MKKINLIIIAVFLTTYGSFAQIAIGTKTPHPSAALDIRFTDKGVLLPRVSLSSTADITTINSPAHSLIVYNTSTQNDVTPGFYHWDATMLKWKRLLDSITAASGWSTSGNAGIVAGRDFIGTTDNADLIFKRDNLQAGLLSDRNSSNFVIGNTSFGVGSYKGTEEESLLGRWNTAIGYYSLNGPTDGIIRGHDNTAVGAYSLKVNHKGMQNVAVGSQSLMNNIDGIQNTAIGHQSLFANSNGNNNVAQGAFALKLNKGNNNVGIGTEALENNTTGESNTASGTKAMKNNDSGKFNTAVGASAMFENISGNGNSALGYLALSVNTTGSNNTAIGSHSGPTKPDLVNSTAIGYGATVSESNTIQLGNTSITAIMGQVPFTTTSDQRYKEHIKTIPLGLDFINKLHPVEYVRKNNVSKTKEWGFIAQEVQQTLKDVAYKDAGIVKVDQSSDKMLSMRYTDLIAPMIQSIQDLSEQNKELQEEDSLQNDRINQLEKELEQLKKRAKQIQQLKMKNN